MKKNDTLTPLRKLGYESGIGSESIVYNMFYVYFILFLTTVAGINPVLAGTISLISVLVDAVTDPLIGWICDKPGADMKKYMLVGGVFKAYFSDLHSSSFREARLSNSYTIQSYPR